MEPIEKVEGQEVVKPVVEEPKPVVEEPKNIGASELSEAVYAEPVEKPAEEVVKPAEGTEVVKPAEEVVKPEVKLSDEEVAKRVKEHVGGKTTPAMRIDPNAAAVKVNEAAIKIAQEYAETQDPAKLVELIGTVGKDIGSSILNSVIAQSTAMEYNNKRKESDGKVYTKYPELIDVARTVDALAKEKNNKFTSADVEAAYGKKLPDISTKMTEVYREMPELLRMADGGTKCMKIAEDRIKAMGPVKEAVEGKVVEAAPVVEKPSAKTVEEIREEETARQDKNRAGAIIASGASASSESNDKGVDGLTVEEVRYANNMGISPEAYAKRKANKYIHNTEYYNRNRLTAIRKSKPSDGGAK